ncbi:cytochrome ubiquinol oxidase subunit I [Ponticoccus sp. SC2-23]|uniref:cytochrome ubiquinol oxidase subunit I n=1 Tax=Alexandriicola marinus TaxID=2081710 RepID=UPI000FD73339|nr:cytochrome ubiquinol oxidase subunit I [Alexandriicola marinus]MBM1219513.1 cytochrome ubiquinol oxidase subunit I [Ponticoccus sp. SC6-9]MBM1223415.1 cytochrome ubiquinol oxidase subunit I [Ponticoccus sp. SC6-15]MBM1229326.1 cytochrome ubiquinol oxidase subunit I [Ponticoccus sp. SC6-38]MBM1232381.1 cytochrome ubiquinol oxidase subunit I [Ponticoccus sp. SC6-45]MBM1237669.1 cytochrome ubiquinol oxidase subunit I [Ponticoccus sp. SC6-49]MBM1241392.1 cytochrome ubiquinol oxidase subunit I 
MDMLDGFILSRIQFAANISFHILFPTITIALGWVLVFFKLSFARTGNEAWMKAYFFWVKVFALSFAMGVVSGITMSFQFGTNWPGFMESVGNIAGPLLAYEVLTAFFLEAVFLGIMLFGFSRVPGWAHTGATILVAFGTTMSAFWILVLNSWMHTPAGFEMRDGVAFATDWFAIIFNPSMPYRLVHMLLASGLTVAFLIASLSALRWLMGDRGEDVRKTLRLGMVMGAVLIPIQILAGDMHGLNTLEHQPAKVAAMEGNWETQSNVPLLLFAIPDEAARENRFEIGIPNGASLILKHHADGVVPGLNDFVAEDGTIQHPPVAPVFWSFRVMVATGMAMLVMSWAALFFMRRGRGIEGLPRIMIWALVPMGLSGWVATLAGWYTTEIGRQPWLVTGVLDTKAAVGDVAPALVASTLIAYLVVYAALLVAYIGTLVYLARRQVGQDHDKTEGRPATGAVQGLPAE